MIVQFQERLRRLRKAGHQECPKPIRLAVGLVGEPTVVTRPRDQPIRITALSKLVFLAVVSELIYLLIALAGQSLHVEGVGDWSLLTILGLFTVAFFIYLLAIQVALAAQQDRRLLMAIGLSAVVFRLTLLCTDPIAELDIYRYLWDGEVCSHGVNPYRYSPAQVLAASNGAYNPSNPVLVNPPPSDLAMLVGMRDDSPELAEILRRIHFAELRTIYPPTSQVVFTLASLTTPNTASISHRMVIFKAWFVLFDLLTFVLLVMLLRYAGRPVAWSIAYGWCPLLIKEIANSGHLDAVAVFFATLAVLLTVRSCFRPASSWSEGANNRGSKRMMLGAALTLSLAIGAKLYPLVLVPLILFASLRQFGMRITIMVGLVLLMTTCLIMWPMVPTGKLTELTPFRFPSTADELPPLPPPHIGTEVSDPSESLRAFLSEWEMNDFLFLLLMENIRPTRELPANHVAWFSVIPEDWRKPVRELTGQITGVEPSRTPFFFSRAVTSAALLALAIGLAWHAGKRRTVEAFLEAAFLTVAWFWLILPTGNPWYWTWALPLLPFARSRVWLVLSGLVMIYYMRFWLTFHYPDPPVLKTDYNGALFFDYVVTWLEFGPWFVVLGIAYIHALRRRDRFATVAVPQSTMPKH